MATIPGLGYIYRYLLDGKTVYVGQTKDLDKRIQAHSQETRFFGLTDIQFKGCRTEHLNNVEAYFIDKYNPILNRVHPKIKDENIEEVINRLFDWETYQKPIPVVLPLIDLNPEHMITNYISKKGECSGQVWYATGLPVDEEKIPLTNKYYTFGRGKDKFDCVLLEDFDTQMRTIRKNFTQEVERVANQLIKEHKLASEIEIYNE